MKTFTQNPLLKHQHLKVYVIIMAKMILMKYIAWTRISQLKLNIFGCQYAHLLTKIDL